MHRFLRSAIWIVAVTPALLFLGCETRDRSNPFDPENTETGGRPRVLNAIAGDASVLLRWELDEFDDPRGLRLLREVAGARLLILEQDKVAGGEFVDMPLPNDIEIRYHLEIQDPSGVWLATEPDAATPGPTRAWVGDAVGGGLLRLSPDGRDSFGRVSFGDFLDMEVEEDGTVWAPNWSQGEILRLDADGEISQRFDHRGGNTIAIDRVTRQLWVGSFNAGALTRYDRTGKQQWTLNEVGPVEDVEAARDFDGGLWAAIRFAGVWRISNDVVVDRWDQFQWPVSLAESADGFLWVVDRATQTVSKIVVSTGEVVANSVGLGDPVDGTLDGNGGFWVADRGRGGLVHLDAAAAELAFFGVGRVSGVTYDSVGERLWVVFRDDGRVATFTPEGEELSSLLIGGRPVKVEGNWP